MIMLMSMPKHGSDSNLHNRIFAFCDICNFQQLINPKLKDHDPVSIRGDATR